MSLEAREEGTGQVAAFFFLVPLIKSVKKNHASLPCILQHSTSMLLDASVPLADIVRPEDDTLHSSTDPSIPSGTNQLFALIVKSEEERFYTCIKSGGQASNKWYALAVNTLSYT